MRSQKSFYRIRGELPAGAVEVEIASVGGPRQLQELVRNAGVGQSGGQAVALLDRNQFVAPAVDEQRGRGAGTNVLDRGCEPVCIRDVGGAPAEKIFQHAVRVDDARVRRMFVPVYEGRRPVERNDTADGGVGGGVCGQQRQVCAGRPADQKEPTGVEPEFTGVALEILDRRRNILGGGREAPARRQAIGDRGDDVAA